MKILIFGVLLLVFLGGCSEEKELKINISSENINAGEELRISIEGDAEEVSIELGREIKSILCNKFECNEEIIFKPSPGIYNLKITTTKGNEIKGKIVRKIIVSENSENSCLDKTLFGKCSGEMPYYCDNGKLIEKCVECGCENGHFCNETECIPIAGKISIEQIEFKEKVEAEKKFSIKIILKNGEGTKKGANYSAKLEIGENKFEKNFLGEDKKIEFEGISLSEGIFDIKIEIFALNKEREVVYEEFLKNAIESLIDIEPPAKPSINYIFAEGDDVVIEWTEINGADGYRLYKSVDANPAFISHKLIKTFEGNTNSGIVQALNSGAHYFVITAIDSFGNESEFSEVKSVNIGKGIE